LLGMGKYFHIHNYSSNLEARIDIYHIQGKNSTWGRRGATEVGQTS